ncbi:MAG: FO synthase [Gordonia sp. (in: high G+C Gram-positive bacteria)]
MVLRAWAADRPAPIKQVRHALTRVRADPSSVSDDEWVALLGAAGDELDELAALADAARADVTDPDTFTFVVNRNLETAAVARADAPVAVEELVAEAWELGATEVCIQGPLPPDAADDGYLRLVERVRSAAPAIHLHAFRPPEVRDAATRMGIAVTEFLSRARAAGLGSVPGTAAQILDDEVRAALHPAGTPDPLGTWIDTISAAHQVGLFSTATMLYGHRETPRQQLAHLRIIAEIAGRTKGFTELIVMPMVPETTPAHLREMATGVASVRETRAVHAVARLITLGRIDHVQVAWTKLDRDTVVALLCGGADDIGGLLLDGILAPDAGQEAGRTLGVGDLREIGERIGRRPRQRTTGYGAPPADRHIALPVTGGRTQVPR